MEQTLRPLDWVWVAGAFFLVFFAAFVSLAADEIRLGNVVSTGVLLVLGGFLAWGGIYFLRLSIPANRATRERNRRAQQYPNEPWRWLPEWDGTRTVHKDRRFGPTVLELREVPVRLGGELHATLQTSLRELPPEKLEVLVAAQVTSSRHGNRGRTVVTSEVVWKGHRQVKGVLDPERGVTIDVVREIPDNFPEFNDSDPSAEVIWTLTVTARIKGRLFHARFRLPVFSA